MRLSPFVRTLVGLATIAPLLMMLLPGAFMVVVALGIWDHVDQFLLAHLPLKTIESIGWSALLILGYVVVAIHVALVVFYICHIITNRSAPRDVRIVFAITLFVIPTVGMALYWFIYIFLEKPPTWALKTASPTGRVT